MSNEINQELSDIIEKQNKVISELMNENAEKENLINTLMSEFTVKTP